VNRQIRKGLSIMAFFFLKEYFNNFCIFICKPCILKPWIGGIGTSSAASVEVKERTERLTKVKVIHQ